MEKQRPTASDSLDPMGFEKRWRGDEKEKRQIWGGGRQAGRGVDGQRQQESRGRCTPSGTGLGYEELQRRRGTGAPISSNVSNIIAFNPFIDMEVKLQTAAKM
ncbi:hypothetical protein N5P37_002264 [Trichoderma harzianum]|nr:hypothetical protein N5P37_002264 [Trichoderma harzianum]